MRNRDPRTRGPSGTITLTVRSDDMEHFKSTLATTAFAVLGLVAAAHILHPGNYEAQVRPARPPVVIAASTAAWIDPPADLRVAAASPTRAADASGAGVMSGLVAPRMIADLPAAEMMAPTVPGAMAAAMPAQPERGRKSAASASRRKVVQRAARTRQASLDRGVIAERPVAHPSDVPAAPKVKIDPIGDLIRGLGLGGES